MAKRPIVFISFQFEPVSDGYLFGEPASRMQTARLNLVLWRSRKDGRPEISEVHALGLAEGIDDFDRLVDKLDQELRKVRRDSRDWFAPPRPFWRR